MASAGLASPAPAPAPAEPPAPAGNWNWIFGGATHHGPEGLQGLSAAANKAEKRMRERARCKRLRAESKELVEELDKLVPVVGPVEVDPQRRRKLTSGRTVVEMLDDAKRVVHLRALAQPAADDAFRKAAAAVSAAGNANCPPQNESPKSSYRGAGMERGRDMGGKSGVQALVTAGNESSTIGDEVASPGAEDAPSIDLVMQVLRDPMSPCQIHPDLFREGIQQAEGIGAFTLDLTSKWQVIDWNRGMEAISVSADLAKTTPFHFLVEDFPHDFSSAVESTLRNLAEGDQREFHEHPATLALMCITSGSVAFNPVQVLSISISKKSGSGLCTIIAEGHRDVDSNTSVGGLQELPSMQNDLVEMTVLSSTSSAPVGQDWGILGSLEAGMRDACPTIAVGLRGLFNRLAVQIISTWTLTVGSACGILMAVVNRFIRPAMSVVQDADGGDTCYFQVSVQFPNSFAIRSFLFAKFRLDGLMHRFWGPAGQELTVAVGYKWKTASRKYPAAAYSFTIFLFTPKTEADAAEMIRRYNQHAKENDGKVSIPQLQACRRFDHHLTVSQDGERRLLCEVDHLCQTSPSRSFSQTVNSTGRLIPHSDFPENFDMPHPCGIRLKPF